MAHSPDFRPDRMAVLIDHGTGLESNARRVPCETVVGRNKRTEEIRSTLASSPSGSSSGSVLGIGVPWPNPFGPTISRNLQIFVWEP